MTGGAGYSDFAVLALYDLLNDGQAQAGTSSGFLGGEKWHEIWSAFQVER